VLTCRQNPALVAQGIWAWTDRMVRRSDPEAIIVIRPSAHVPSRSQGDDRERGRLWNVEPG
jgi:hypothetical protein